MPSQPSSSSFPQSETGLRVDAVAEWRSALAGHVAGALLFLTVTGLVLFFVPGWRPAEHAALLHTVVGILFTVPLGVYTWRHFRVRKGGRLSHYQLLGYAAAILLLVCVVSGLVETWQAAVGPRVAPAMRLTHLVSGVTAALLVAFHLATVVLRRVSVPLVLARLRPARRVYFARAAAGAAAFSLAWAAWAAIERPPDVRRPFPEDYNWRFGPDRPFAPSLARLDDEGWSERVTAEVAELVPQEDRAAFLEVVRRPDPDRRGLFVHLREAADAVGLPAEDRARMEEILDRAAAEIRERGAVDPRALAGSARCGTAGCHEEIHREWLPSAHRYSSLDELFQRVQAIMAVELSPEHTRYCAGCHDPISLFSGSKNPGNITLSAVGADEGSSCIVCHSIVQTDVQGNGDYVLRPPRRMAYETSDSPVGRFLGDFLIRALPDPHVRAYSRPLYKTPEFCAACHKQYIDIEVNLDIGKVQGQNQYDSWRNSRWHHPEDPSRTITCRECHMPLVAGEDPASGDSSDPYRSPDDGMHRDHSTVGANTFIPAHHRLEGWERHVAKVERWLRGERTIPEIADRWSSGPAVRVEVEAPESVGAGESIPVSVHVTNNKAGHDFPTGPLDMIESWIEVIARDESGEVFYRRGTLDRNQQAVDPLVVYRADEFDRGGELIDRHNLWDLVGAAYKRALFPGFVDTVGARIPCPSTLRFSDEQPVGRREEQVRVEVPRGTVGAVVVEARLLYRKANPTFLDRVFADDPLRAPVVEVARGSARVEIVAP